MSEEKTLGQKLGDYMVEWAKRNGISVITRVIPFLNDDVSKYLENLHRFEEASRRVNIRVGAYQPQPVYT